MLSIWWAFLRFRKKTAKDFGGPHRGGTIHDLRKPFAQFLYPGVLVDEVICRPPIPLRLLVVDDHEIVRVGLRNLLTSATSDWHVCGEAEDGLEAIAKALELAPDVVILDLTMPKMNGIEAATEIRRLAPATKIILFSAHDVPRDIRKPCDAFVSKLSGGRELLTTIENLISRTAETAPLPMPQR